MTVVLSHQLAWGQVIQAFAGAKSGWGRMHFLGHADGNPYASASVPWRFLCFPSLFLEAQGLERISVKLQLLAAQMFDVTLKYLKPIDGT